MGIEKYLVATDVLCSRELPAEDCGWDTDIGGPGYRTAELAASHGLPVADAAVRATEAERLYEDREALATRLTERWGEPSLMGLQTIRLRIAAEAIPEPWARLSHLVRDAYVWQEPELGRWIVLGVADRDRADEIRLLLTVTETDPP
ncbi:hypothetical protein [Streptomyces actuosus]|uniref:hypothetical protein n=1 Tax=Streptomyces actuosus TaxID=1885 RepID=UPI001F0536CB|nr:hypothetical protein [Streptomyces actuosus]